MWDSTVANLSIFVWTVYYCCHSWKGFHLILFFIVFAPLLLFASVISSKWIRNRKFAFRKKTSTEIDMTFSKKNAVYAKRKYLKEGYCCKAAGRWSTLHSHIIERRKIKCTPTFFKKDTVARFPSKSWWSFQRPFRFFWRSQFLSRVDECKTEWSLHLLQAIC